MTDIEKLSVINAEIERRIDEAEEHNRHSTADELDNILCFINSLPEEPISEGLEEVAEQYKKTLRHHEMIGELPIHAFKAGAQWALSQFKKIEGEGTDWYSHHDS